MTYNNTLAKDKRIEIVGLDIELFPRTTLRYLQEILPHEDPSPLIKENIDFLKEYTDLEIRVYKGKKIIETFKEDLIAKEEVYQAYLGEHFMSVKLAIDNLATSQRLIVSRGEIGLQVREERIYKNFLLLKDELEKEKSFGQWGAMHILQEKEGKWESFIARGIKGDKNLHKKVLSIVYQYSDCKMMTWNSEKTTEGKAISIMDPIFKGFWSGINPSVEILRLNAWITPFDKLGWKTLGSEERTDIPITSYAQYVIFITGSDGYEPLIN